MLPIHQVLSRIRWDARFRAGRFHIGYYDRRERRILVVPFECITFPADNHFAFELYDEDGARRRIPLHRVRRVYRNGRLIWARHPPREAPAP